LNKTIDPHINLTIFKFGRLQFHIMLSEIVVLRMKAFIKSREIQKR